MEEMIELFSGQPVYGQPDWAVKNSGLYNPDSLVECYRISDPEQIVAYFATFIIDGSYPSGS